MLMLAPVQQTYLSERVYHISHQLTLTKEKFKIDDGNGNVLLWAETPSFTLKKQFHVFADEAGTQLLLEINIRKALEIH